MESIKHISDISLITIKKMLLFPSPVHRHQQRTLSVCSQCIGRLHTSAVYILSILTIVSVLQTFLTGVLSIKRFQIVQLALSYLLFIYVRNALTLHTDITVYTNLNYLTYLFLILLSLLYITCCYFIFVLFVLMFLILVPLVYIGLMLT